MFAKLHKLFQKKEQPAVAETIAAGPTGKPADAADVILLDTHLTGWFNKETGELITDFPIKPTDCVLDVGCGDGHFVQFCAEQGAEVMFADISIEKIGKLAAALKSSPARKLCPMVSDANPLPLPDAVADKVIAMEVMEHVDDPVQFMRELVRVGKADALFLITVPAAESENIQKGIAPPVYFEKPNHIRIFQNEELREIIEQEGLVIEKSFNYGFFWSVWWFLFWACKQDLLDPWHPILVNWGRTWNLLLETEDGLRIKKALDNACPKSYGFIARKRG